MIIPLDATAAITDSDGRPTQAFRTFMLQVTEESLISGNGTPEGVLEAGKGRQYMDEDGVTGAVLYIKQKEDIGGNRRLGWILA